MNEQGGDTPHLASWSQRAQTTAPHFSARAFRPERPHEPAAGDGRQRPGTYRFPLAKAQTYRHQVTRDTTTHEHVSQRQQRLAQRARLESVDYEASGNYPGLSAGMTISVRGETCAPTDRFYLYRLSHEAFDHSQHGYHAAGERDTPEYGYQHTFQCYPQTHTYVPAETTPKPCIDGAIPAVVVGPPDTPVYSNSAGVVKVCFHWDRQADDLKGSPWIRVVQRFAGPEWGSQFLPRVGQEVLVMFTDGNPDKPVIVGSYYHAATPHPFEPVRQSGIKTQSLSGDNADAGHQLRLDDTPHQEELYLKSQRDQDVHVKGDSEQHIGQHSEIQVAGGPVLTQVGGDLRIEAAEALHLHVGTSEIVLDARGVHVHADTVTLDRVAPVPDAFAAPAQAPDSAPHPDDAAAVNAAVTDSNLEKNLYPSAEIKVVDLQANYVKKFGAYILKISNSLNAQLTVGNKNSVNPTTFDRDGFKIEAKNETIKVFSEYKIKNPDSILESSPTITFYNEYNEYTVELTPKFISENEQQYAGTLNKGSSIEYGDWLIKGDLAMNVMVTVSKEQSKISWLRLILIRFFGELFKLPLSFCIAAQILLESNSPK